MLADIAFGERERDVLARLSGKGVRWRELLLLYPGSVFRMGWKACGALFRVGLGSRNWTRRTAAARTLGMDLRRLEPEGNDV